MRRLPAWFSRFGGLFGKERRERELSAEMESHLQMHVEDNLRAGMSPEQARREAIMKLGGVEQTKEAVSRIAEAYRCSKPSSRIFAFRRAHVA